MANYADRSDAEATVGMQFSDNTRPTIDHADNLLDLCTGIINGIMKVTANIVDSYGYLKAVELRLFWKYINNILALSEPNLYEYMKPDLEEDDLKLIRMTYDKWTSLSWDIGQ
ncbi:MAG: hypothetical protein GY853_16730 [PVC group bacterium]|nr:hypothetical protein [PVC group bacterium]